MTKKMLLLCTLFTGTLIGKSTWGKIADTAKKTGEAIKKVVVDDPKKAAKSAQAVPDACSNLKNALGGAHWQFIKVLQGHLEMLNKLIEFKTEYIAHKSKYKNLKEKVLKLREELYTVRSAYLTMKRTFYASKQEYIEILKACPGNAKRIQPLEAEQATTANEIRVLEAELDKIGAENAAARSEYKKLGNEIMHLGIDLGKLRNKIAPLQKKLQEAQDASRKIFG